MSRPLRIEYPGAWYHVMNRGTGRRWIFKRDYHYDYFLSLLSDVTERYSAEVHAYCLMGDHYHLMLRTPEADLQRMMRHVNGVYTQYFNRKERTDGALFRGRYKAIIVDAQSYGLTLSRYIHRNPVEAGIVRRLAGYRWSSYPAYIGKVATPKWLFTDEILGAMGKRQAKSRYKDYVSKGNSQELVKHYGQKYIKPILGDKDFKKAVLERFDSNSEVTQGARTKPELGQVLVVVSNYYDVAEDELLISTRGRGVITPARSVAMYICQQLCGMKLPLIAEEFGLSGYASAGSSIRNVRKRLTEDRQLRKDINYIKQELTP